MHLNKYHITNIHSVSSNCEVLTTLTPDTARILSKLHAVQPCGNISFCTGIRVAHVGLLLSLKRNGDARDCFYLNLYDFGFAYCSWPWSTDREKTTRCALLCLLAVQWRIMKKKWVSFCSIFLYVHKKFMHVWLFHICSWSKWQSGSRRKKSTWMS